MNSSTWPLSERSLDRTLRILGVAVLVLLVAFVAFYAVDRYRGESTKAPDSQQALEAQIRADPSNLTLRVALGDVLVSKKAYDQGIAEYLSALAGDPNNAGAIAGLGNAYMRKGDNDKAIQYLVQYKELVKSSDYAVADRRLQAVFYYLGQLYLQQGKLDDAAEALKSALAIDRSDSDAYYLLGNVFIAQGDPGQAVDAYRTAVAFVPDFVEAYQGMQQAYEKLGDTTRVAYPRAMLAVLSGDRTKALREMEDYVGQVKDDVGALLALGWAYEDSGQPAEALGAYQRALATDPNNKVAQSAVRRLGGK